VTRRPIVVHAMIALEAAGDATLDEIKRAYEEHAPRLPFPVGAATATQATQVFVTRLHVSDISEQPQEQAA
jgi:hypothetical protein